MALPDPYIRKSPNDLIRSGDWNEIQSLGRQELRAHTHRGGDDGTKIPREGIVPGAIDGSLIDPSATVGLATLNAATVNVSSSLKVLNRELVTEINNLLARATALEARATTLESGKVNRAGDTITGALTIQGVLTPSVGNDETKGILFPRDPGGGAGDRAFIRYFVESGETTKLLIGNNNDADDRVSLYQMSGERLTIYNGCVGINNVTPAAALDVSAIGQTWGTWFEAIRFSRSEHSAITHPGGQLLFGMHSDRNFYFADTSAGRYLAVISPANGGRLGIGTNGPGGYPLHVKSSSTDWQARFENTSSNANVYLSHGGGYGMHVRTDTASTTNYLLELYNGSQGGTKFFVSTAGRVGIGTASPEASLHVTGGSRFSGERHFFTDVEASGRLRVGSAWNVPGLYSEDNQDIVVGCASGRSVYLGQTSRSVRILDGKLATQGYDPNQGTPKGWGGGITTWDIIVNANGFAHGSFQNGSFDLAEKFHRHEDGLEPGDVLAVDPRSPERLIKSRAAQQDDLVGVVSERPGFLLGVHWEDPEAGIPLALAGRVPVKVNLEGGPIRIGDYLTSSSQPGVAMRTIRPGRVIGLAMEAFDGASGAEGKVVVLVNPHWFGGR